MELFRKNSKRFFFSQKSSTTVMPDRVLNMLPKKYFSGNHKVILEMLILGPLSARLIHTLIPDSGIL